MKRQTKHSFFSFKMTKFGTIRHLVTPGIDLNQTYCQVSLAKMGLFLVSREL